MTEQELKLHECYKFCQSRIKAETGGFIPEIAVVLGSGLGGFADSIEVVAAIPYSDIPGFPVSTVPGHSGRYVFGYAGKIAVVIMQGRVHWYEGYDMSDVVLPVRLTRLMGASKLILTNAVGSVNLDFKPGDFMLIRDHISGFVANPLRGGNFDSLGVRFPDMSEIYSEKLRKIIADTAKEQGINLREGVYLQTPGPSFETPSEIKMYRLLGADVVGMSTACDAIAARHAGFEIAGISSVSNLGCGISKHPLSHAEVLEAADKSAPVFKSLLRGVITAVAE
ncbi:purine-nucleoside phosphorylase [Clostridia bacterium]|nr:purine-nucleoside phosphorylase [Clostridia bacterium]